MTTAAPAAATRASIVVGTALALMSMLGCSTLQGQLDPGAASSPVPASSPSATVIEPTPSSSPTSAPKPADQPVAPGAAKPESKAPSEPKPKAEPKPEPKAKPKPTLKPGPAIMRGGSSGTQVRELQARLKQIGWFGTSVSGTYGSVTTAAVEGFQAKRAIPETGAVDRRTWLRLTAMTRRPTHDEMHNIVLKPSKAGLDSRCLTGRALCISKSSRSLVWVVDGKPQLRVDVRFGSYETPTREGAFSVGWKSRDHVSTIYHTKMPYAMFFSGGQAVHYSPDFAARGYAGASHGCVNVRNLAGIQTLFNDVRVGDKVIVYR